MHRRMTKEVRIGGRVIGGQNPILIQSMTNTRTADVDATVRQILELEKEGVEIIRSTVPDEESALAFREIKKAIHVPLVADIHFNYRLAIAAVENGADKIRINPGNLGGIDNLRAVVSSCKERGVPIRVGVNSGSLEKDLLEKYGSATPEALSESAVRNVRLIEEMGYDAIVVSIKSSDVLTCVRAYELASDALSYPMHIGITEAGTVNAGNIKSAIGLSLLLHEGIGDTLRVSLTGDPVEEVRSAKTILRTLRLRQGGIEVVSCPTCGRTKIDLITLAKRVEEIALRYPEKSLKVAVMGCVVNGPGEAREADFAICGGDQMGLLLKKGEIIAKLPEEELLPALEKSLKEA